MRRRSPQVLDSVRKYFHSQMDKFAASNDKREKAYKEGIANKEALTDDDDGHPVDDLNAQMGKPLLAYQVIERLKRLNPNLYFEISHVTGKYGVYFYDGLNPKVYLFAMENEFTPEYSVRVTHQETGKFKEFRGYRTVLLRLIKQRYITEAGAEREFGLPSRSTARWSRPLGKVN